MFIDATLNLIGRTTGFVKIERHQGKMKVGITIHFIQLLNPKSIRSERYINHGKTQIQIIDLRICKSNYNLHYPLVVISETELWRMGCEVKFNLSAML